MRGPSGVMAIVCSKCAASEPSSVEIVQPSSAIEMSGPPAVIIGSTAMVIPFGEPRAASGIAEVRNVRILVVVAPDAVADEASHDGEAGILDDGLHGVRDVSDPILVARLGDSRRERLLCDIQQALRLGLDLAHGERVRAVCDVRVERDPDVDRHEIAVSELVGPGIPCTTTAFGEMQIAFG